MGCSLISRKSAERNAEIRRDPLSTQWGGSTGDIIVALFYPAPLDRDLEVVLFTRIQTNRWHAPSGPDSLGLGHPSRMDPDLADLRAPFGRPVSNQQVTRPPDPRHPESEPGKNRRAARNMEPASDNVGLPGIQSTCYID